MSRKALFLLLTSTSCLAGRAFCFDTASSAQASPGKTAPIELYHQVAEAQAAAAKGNSELLDKMELLAAHFKKYRLSTGAFPEAGRPSQALSSHLGQLAGKNPFAQFPVATAADNPDFAAAHGLPDFNQERIQVHIVADASLSNSRLEALQTKVPDEWQELPGTITIIHNTENLFAIWGAGVDGKPIKDSKNRRYVIIIAEI